MVILSLIKIAVKDENGREWVEMQLEKEKLLVKCIKNEGLFGKGLRCIGISDRKKFRALTV